MGRIVFLRSPYRSAFSRSRRCTVANFSDSHLQQPRHGLPLPPLSRSLFHLAPTATPRKFECRARFALGSESVRSFTTDDAHLSSIRDPEILKSFKELMSAHWDELEPSVIYDAKKALSKSTDDKPSQEALANVYCAAEAVEEFASLIKSLRLAIDGSTGPLGESVKPLSDEFRDALRAVYQKYNTYLDAFGPEESYLRKKVEAELGSKMIQLKSRCSGLGSEWGKITVLGTSGLSGSYIEQRDN
nr:succinate dehydrogenase 5 [Viscum album]